MLNQLYPYKYLFEKGTVRLSPCDQKVTGSSIGISHWQSQVRLLTIHPLRWSPFPDHAWTRDACTPGCPDMYLMYLSESSNLAFENNLSGKSVFIQKRNSIVHLLDRKTLVYGFFYIICASSSLWVSAFQIGSILSRVNNGSILSSKLMG